MNLACHKMRALQQILQTETKPESISIVFGTHQLCLVPNTTVNCVLHFTYNVMLSFREKKLEFSG